MAAMNPGDVVRLKSAVVPQKLVDTKNNEFWVVDDNSRRKTKPPWMLFNSVTGIYIGEERKPVKDGRASRGVVRRLYHKFVFGVEEVMIEPQLVDVFITFEEVMEDDDGDKN